MVSGIKEKPEAQGNVVQSGQTPMQGLSEDGASSVGSRS